MGRGGIGAIGHFCSTLIVRCPDQLRLLVLLQVLALVSTNTPDPGRQIFQFTHSFYNGSISENAHGKTYILSPVRMGIDRGTSRLDIEYKIKGDRSSIFRAESECVLDFCFLRIRTRSDASGELNREHKDHFDFRVEANGKNVTSHIFTTHADVKISVQDENDLSPLFYPEEYHISIPENTTLHENIVKVTASDADIGINGEIYYSFLKPTKLFSVHPTSGSVSLTRFLTYSLQDKHVLRVVATDRGKNTGNVHRSSTAAVIIMVEPVNFHSPEIIVQKHPTVAERQNGEVVYAILHIHDDDYGDNGKIRNIEIMKGNVNNIFQILQSDKGKETYNLIVDGPVDRETFPNGYNVTVCASDKGTPSRMSCIVEHVSIQDANDNEPEFDKVEYNVSLSEIVPVGSPVVRVHAGDSDVGRNGEVEYSIVAGDPSSLFHIQPESGLVSTTASLDAEKLIQVSLHIQAEDQANSGARKIGKTVVNIEISDFNDNAPVFDLTSLSGSVKENSVVGTSVLRVVATDADRGENGRVSYSIVNSESVPFEIDHFTGAIKTTTSLDFETMRKFYTIHIRASDWGNPHRRETDALATIKLENTNDNNPEFEKVQCMGLLARDAKENTEIVVLSAIDFDGEDIIYYNIIDGNMYNCFKIAPSSGEIALTRDCDLSLLDDTVKLRVMATDGSRDSSIATVILTLVNSKSSIQNGLDGAKVECQNTDVADRLRALIQASNENNQAITEEIFGQETFTNDYAPEFGSSVPKYFEVSEGTEVGMAVLNMTAIDRDKNDWYNSMLLYVISAGNSDGAFRMDTLTGQLVVMSELDRETRGEYNLQVTAQDMGTPAYSEQQLLRVVITDENDNHPCFEQMSPYFKSVYEYVAVNSTVLQVYATDADKDLNARITYSLLTDTQDFYIEPSNGMIKVRRQLDRERQAVYHLHVMAKDSGIHKQLSSTTQAEIVLQDVNDNEPRFVPSSYSVKVREDLPVGTVVMILTATDPDEGSNGKVLYKLVDGVEDKFSIDDQTGTIRISRKLDFESQQVYNITARAEDGGKPRLVSTCMINVEVVDVDENLFAPVFDKGFITRTYIYENNAVGQFVVRVKARDQLGLAEGGGEGEVTYSITGGTGLGFFTVDNNGTIRASEVLDAEETSHYWLTVYAQDASQVPQFARHDVLVEVLDVNDNVPLSVAPSYKGSVLENSKAGVEVIQVEARDADLSGGTPLSFHITAGDPQRFFEIDHRSGLIRTTGRILNRENLPQHSIEVTIKDNGRDNPLMSITRVTIDIIDENDNRPRFVDKAPTVSVLEARHDGVKDLAVYRVLARDRDEGENAHITYSINQAWRSLFRVDPETGMIYSTQHLLRGSLHVLQVKATDGGVRPKKATIKLRVRVVAPPTSSVSAPTFKQKQYLLSVAENEPIGQLVEMLSGEDRDGHQIWYFIQGGNEDNKFAIQPEHGSLWVAGVLDWETQDHYQLDVCATDGLNNTCVPVEIAIKDINDNDPEFSAVQYTAEVGEDAPVGHSVLQLFASDQDEDKRLFFTITAASATSSLRKFNINPQTGEVSVAESLDHEVLMLHTLTVMVRDLGTPSRRSYAHIHVHVLDSNDQPPRFLSPVFTGRVFQTAAVGTSVLQVFASDNDKGQNAELSFSIISGNIGGTFAVDEKLGIVSVAKVLKREEKANYVLTVMVVDHGPLPLSSTSQVEITVTRSNNAPPLFTHEQYTSDLHENSLPGQAVLVVHADSQASVLYKIHTGNNLNFLVMNPNSGVISTKQSVDYESKHIFNLTVTATSIVGSSSNCTVVVHVLDENDNAPIFNQDVYIGNISERANPYSMVFTDQGSPLVVKATDKDSGVNALLKYEIVDAKLRAVFAVEPSTGAIKTRSTLDHETRSMYNFTVQVTDLGSPSMQAVTPARVIIYVSDVNDSPPIFTNHTYYTKVLLPTYRDVVILKLAAHDPDLDTRLLYSIVGGNRKGHFDVNSTSGEVFVCEEGQGMEDKYGLTVQVSDGKYDTTASVVVSVESTVDSGLHFSRSTYHVSVLEEQSSSKELTAVMAVGHRLNEALQFTLLNNKAMFTLKKTSGILETRGIPFDREITSNYTVIVEVRDTRGRLAHGVVIVTVLDINDNDPEFMGLPYNSVVAFNASEEDTIRKVEAYDRDSGINGQVRYSITDGGHGRFNINLITGDITVNKLLPSDENMVFTLTVEAQDMGHPPRRREVEVPIHVVGTSSPVFSHQVYNVSVRENTPIHTPVISIKASSPHHHKLIYSISTGDKYGDFAVNFDTAMDVLGSCLLSVMGCLDFEQIKLYEVTVRGTDTVTGAFAEAIVFIHLQDVNDNRPLFESQSYTVAVTEALPLGSQVLKVRASDQDMGLMARVHYNIAPFTMGHPDVHSFHIESTSGIIMVKKHLDREIQSNFFFLVVAIDGGLPALNSTASVHVQILNVNDNAPAFSQTYYECSITDQAQRGQLVTKVMAYDKDQTEDDLESIASGSLFYSIVDGNEKQTFFINTDNGLITVSEQRDPQFESGYLLNVSVSDGVYTSYARVTIIVRNTNLFAPVFQSSLYLANFSEMNAKMMPVVAVRATDGDRGTYGLLTYSIPSQRLKNIFQIDADTGEIFNKVELDREKESSHLIPVAATDNGGRMGFASVLVNVTDYNDCIPRFLLTDYQGNVYSNASVGQPVMQVKAMDEDAGLNSVIVYSLYSSGLSGTDTEHLFQVHPNTGLITVTGDLSRSVNKMYQLFVGAANKEQTSMQDRAAVDILVIGAGDLAPSFEKDKFKFFIDENSSIGYVVATLKAVSNQPVIYSIVAGSLKQNNNPAKFRLNSKGQISVIKELDREDVALYLLTVKAETETSPPLVAYTQVQIKLRDVNDNKPAFDSKPYFASLTENSVPGTRITQLQAFDQDENSMLVYKFDKEIEGTAHLFSLEAHSGWLSLVGELDRELQEEYNVSVLVYDGPAEQPGTHSCSGVVLITVTDYNDNAPAFQHTHFNTAVDEGAAIGTVLGNITAVDRDSGDNALVTYYITDGDPLGQFQVHNTAEIFVNSPLDRETVNQYHLTVAATDGGFVTYITVTVHILDDNDHSPTCKKSLYTEFVEEDVEVNSVIAHIEAHDVDEVNTRNSKLSYFISGEGAEHFVMEMESGVVKTARSLDRESQAEYRLQATVRDGGGRSCTASIFITVTDVNDNVPQFTLTTTTFHIAENAQANTLLTRVTAIDADSGINRRIRYKLADEQEQVFAIDPVSGIISVTRSLDREKQGHYNLTVNAFNPGTMLYTSSVELLVVVGDENDNPPRFERTSYYSTVREDAPLEDPVITVLATSQDIGQNAHITYSITGGNEQGKFKIDSQLSGATVHVSEPLDHELTREYFLTVTATDSGKLPLSSTTLLVVNVTDVNDNPPQFGQTSYQTTVKEDTAVGIEVIRVQATDVDSPVNAAITYTIINGNVEESFSIGRHNGVVKIRTPLDREKVNQYALTVEARDSGISPQHTATTIVSVQVLDANDNPPRFSQANYTCRVQEGRPAGIPILSFSVTDKDLEGNGPPFDFDIVHGNPDREFHVNNEGVLSTASKLNKELKDVYQLTVRVFDSGQPTQYADTVVSVHVIDESMFPPVVRNLSITISSYKDKFPGGIIGKVDYQDDDLYDTVTFQVVSNNRYLFDVDRDSGNVIALVGLDAGNYVVNISVGDGKFTTYSIVTVNVVFVSEDMVDSAVTIQFKNMIPEQFFANSKKKFQTTLKRELDVSERSIEIINVQASMNTGARDRQRWSRDITGDREASTNLDVLFAVRKSGERFMNKNSLKKKVLRVVDVIEREVGVQVMKVFSDLCAHDSCLHSQGICVGRVIFDNNKLMPVTVGGESFVSAQHYYSFQCVCRGGGCKAAEMCGGVVCPAYKLCQMDTVGRHLCVCPNGLTGDLCDQQDSECKPADVNCHKGELPMTFSGHSYARWELGVKTDKLLSLSLWIRTHKLNANLMNSRGMADYSILEIINGRLQYKFNCGSGEGLVSIPVLVNDGLWHKVNIDRHGRIAQMELDLTYQAMSTAPGTNDILNLNNDFMYFGAEVVWHKNYQEISHGFEGCMKEIRLFDVPLLLTGQNRVTENQQFEKIDFNCKEDPWDKDQDICKTFPCMHGGTCMYDGLNSYICQCKPRYRGLKCEVDTDPCEDGPCLHQGQCYKNSEIPNGFVCECQGKFRGKRCEYGKHCIPNPCRHQGLCIEGPNQHMCLCTPGYEGESCEESASLCGSNPCLHGGTCHVYAGGVYHCNCTADRTGTHCQEIALPVITAGIKAEEIYGIAGVGAGLILIVLLFVMCRLWRRRKRDQRRNPRSLRGDDEIHYLGMKEHEMKRKLSNPDVSAVHTYTPQPPPVPIRPASYTPSTHDSLNTLNNFDTVRNYGSAADELETTGIQNIPTFQEYLETFQSRSARSSPLIPARSSRAPSDSDSIEKQSCWQFDYPNIMQHYPQDKKSLTSKCMPVPPPDAPGSLAMCGLQKQDASSYSSLPVSESEEDFNGYHWDTSDWAPGPSLPNISEVPIHEIPDSPTSSNNTDDSNIHISTIDPGMLTDDAAEYVEDSEYVGDSEYTENEFGLDDHDDLPPCYADHPNYEQILELRDIEDAYELPQSLQVSHHPNHYLPNYTFGGHSEHDVWPEAPTETDDNNSNDSEDNDNDSVIHYGYQNVRPVRSTVGSNSYVTGINCNTDHDRSAASVLDDMSVSVGGYTSTNGSCSDVSAYLCEIEDSEVNPSEDEDEEEEEQLSQRLLAATTPLHTKV